MPSKGPPGRSGFVIKRGDRVTLVFPYDADFTAELKGIPARWRSYDGGSRTWTVREPHVDEAVTLALEYFHIEFLVPV